MLDQCVFICMCYLSFRNAVHEALMGEKKRGNLKGLYGRLVSDGVKTGFTLDGRFHARAVILLFF